MTSADGQRRNADIEALFSNLAGQREVPRGTEFTFRGDRDELWADVTAFVDEESVCCPFYTYEQRETDDGVTLTVTTEPAPVKLEL
jgi:hypothetical protein